MSRTALTGPKFNLGDDCAVCGRRVPKNKEVVVSVDPHNDKLVEYVMHSRCRDRVTGSWEMPL